MKATYLVFENGIGSALRIASKEEWSQILAANRGLNREQRRFFIQDCFEDCGTIDCLYIEATKEDYDKWHAENQKRYRQRTGCGDFETLSLDLSIQTDDGSSMLDIMDDGINWEEVMIDGIRMRDLRVCLASWRDWANELLDYYLAGEQNPIPASAVGVGSHKKAIWKGRCGHEWSAVIRNRVAGAGCPYCSHNIVLPGFNDLEILFPEVAQECSPRNLPLKPSQVTAYSNKKVWWQCEHGHEWYTLISTRSYGSKCPYCSGIKLLKGFNDFATLHPGLALEWSERNGSLTPDLVNEKSTKNVWWYCSKCGNEYKAVVKSRVKGLQCPVCAQRAVLPGCNDLATTDPELSLEWDYEKNKRWTPQTISRNSMYPVWWRADCGHTWKAKVCDRAIDKAWCIYCESDFKKCLPQLLVILYAGRSNIKYFLDDEKVIGIPLDAYLPEIKTAFVRETRD